MDNLLDNNTPADSTQSHNNNDYQYRFVVTNEFDHQRLDKFLSEQKLLADFTRSQITKAIKHNLVFINHNLATKTGQRVAMHDVITMKELNLNIVDVSKILGEDIPIDIVYEDAHLLVVNKPSGMVVHPAPGHHSGTLVNALIYKFNDLKVSAENLRPGIVHRIDKDTSGLLVVAKTKKMHALLSDMIRLHQVKRHYLALVCGVVQYDKGKIELPIARSPQNRKKMAVIEEGKHSVTNFVVKERFLNNTLIECMLETGRTHQIRVHLQHFKYPIYGDLQYGQRKHKDPEFGQYLHAYKLEFIHPLTKEHLLLEAEIPKPFQIKLTQLREEILSH